MLGSWRLVFIAYFLLLWPSIVADSVDTAAASEKQESQSPSPPKSRPWNSKSKPPLHAIPLTSANFGSHITDGNVWLIEFYTPSCRHCVAFADAYNNVAAAFHSSPQEKIRVAKVDCQVEKALMARFGIESFPSFFLIDRVSVYVFDEPRSEANLLDFARGGYKKQQPIPYFSSPMGPLGFLHGLFISTGNLFLRWWNTLEDSFRVNPISVGVILSFLCFFAGFIFISALAIFFTPSDKVKVD